MRFITILALLSIFLALCASASPLPTTSRLVIAHRRHISKRWQTATCTTTGASGYTTTLPATIDDLCTSFVSSALGGDGNGRWVSVDDKSWTVVLGVPPGSTATFAKAILRARTGGFYLTNSVCREGLKLVVEKCQLVDEAGKEVTRGGVGYSDDGNLEVLLQYEGV